MIIVQTIYMFSALWNVNAHREPIVAPDPGPPPRPPPPLVAAIHLNRSSRGRQKGYQHRPEVIEKLRSGKLKSSGKQVRGQLRTVADAFTKNDAKRVADVAFGMERAATKRGQQKNSYAVVGAEAVCLNRRIARQTVTPNEDFYLTIEVSGRSYLQCCTGAKVSS